MGYIYIYAFSRHFYPKRLTVHSGYAFLVSILFCKISFGLAFFPVEATRRANAQSVAWPSGLRRCFKAQVSLGAWVQIHSAAKGNFFQRLLWLPWPSKRAFHWLHSTGFATDAPVVGFALFLEGGGWNWAHKVQPTLVVWPSGLSAALKLGTIVHQRWEEGKKEEKRKGRREEDKMNNERPKERNG